VRKEAYASLTVMIAHAGSHLVMQPLRSAASSGRHRQESPAGGTPTWQPTAGPCGVCSYPKLPVGLPRPLAFARRAAFAAFLRLLTPRAPLRRLCAPLCHKHVQERSGYLAVGKYTSASCKRSSVLSDGSTWHNPPKSMVGILARRKFMSNETVQSRAQLLGASHGGAAAPRRCCPPVVHVGGACPRLTDLRRCRPQHQRPKR